MTSLVRSWNRRVEKDEKTVQTQLAINLIRLPDDMLGEIKDFLYIGADDTRRRYFKNTINNIVVDIFREVSYLSDNLGRNRFAHWSCEASTLQLQGLSCMTCGDPDTLHNNRNGCCAYPDEDEDDIIDMVDSDDMIPLAIDEIGDYEDESDDSYGFADEDFSQQMDEEH